MEPAKARLTRGALARMYVKGGHFDQATAELIAALTKEPDRTDLQLLLAEMYAQSGEQVKAINACSTILNKLPYCLGANRLIAKLLQGTEREEESKTYLERVYALSPYDAHVSAQAPTANDVSEQAITIERLRWDGSKSIPEPSETPEWASSLGVDLEQPTSSGGDIPDWLASTPEDSQVPEEVDALTPSLSEDEEIPDWMQDAGWSPSTGEAEEGPSAFSFDDQDDAEPEDAVAADLPDWIQGMAPGAAAGGAADLPETPGAAPEEFMDSAPQEGESAIPDWMGELGDQPDQVSADSPAPESMPGWLEGVEEDAEETGVTDFLVGIKVNKIPSEEPSTEFAPQANEEIPDWLNSSQDEPQIPEGTIEPDQQPQIPESDTPDWLAELEGESSTETPDSSDADIPDWLTEGADVPQEVEPQEAPKLKI
jgi:hypothetical protein